ncbi:hypothetical protein ACFL0D_06445 [Thermoproteota archaeon]
MELCEKQSMYLSMAISIIFFILVLIFIIPGIEVKPVDEGYLIQQINWALSRQTTHAALALSALLGLFSILGNREERPQIDETFIIFLGFVCFLSYEYYKLIRSYNLVNSFEKQLLALDDSYVFYPDGLQQLFFRWPILQAGLLALIIFLVVKIYFKSNKKGI